MVIKFTQVKFTIALRFVNLFAFLFFVSCTEKDVDPSCGCNSPIKETVLDDQGIIVSVNSNGSIEFKYLSLQYGYFDICTEMPQDMQRDGLMILLSGTTRNPCNISKDPLLDIQHYPFHVTNYKIQTDSLFKSPTLRINLFKTTNAVSSGYGYSVKTPFISIYQDVIPAVGGLQTFSTPTKAFKIAVLVGHKSLVTHSLPAIQISDLNYLQALGN